VYYRHRFFMVFGVFIPWSTGFGIFRYFSTVSFSLKLESETDRAKVTKCPNTSTDSME
jgi:hypothetical protein